MAAHTYANHVGSATAVWLNVIHEGIPYLDATQTNGMITSRISQRHMGDAVTGQGGQAERKVHFEPMTITNAKHAQQTCHNADERWVCQSLGSTFAQHSFQ